MSPFTPIWIAKGAVKLSSKLGNRINPLPSLQNLEIRPEPFPSYSTIDIAEQAGLHMMDRLSTTFNLAPVVKFTAENLKRSSVSHFPLIKIEGCPPQSQQGEDGTVAAHRSLGQLIIDGVKLQNHWMNEKLPYEVISVNLAATNIVSESVNKVDSFTERNKSGGLVLCYQDLLQKLCIQNSDSFKFSTYDGFLDVMEKSWLSNLKYVQERYEKEYVDLSTPSAKKKEIEEKIQIIGGYNEAAKIVFEQADSYLKNALTGTEMIFEKWKESSSKVEITE